MFIFTAWIPWRLSRQTGKPWEEGSGLHGVPTTCEDKDRRESVGFPTHTHEDQTPLTEGSERANLSPVVTQQASGELEVAGGGGHHTQALSIVSERSLFQKAVLSQHEVSAKQWLPDLQFLSPPHPKGSGHLRKSLVCGKSTVWILLLWPFSCLIWS